MDPKNSTVFAFLFILLVPASASAQVLISEVMYDLEEGSDSGREWIEVFNAYSSSVTLTDWRLYENDTNHKINSFSGSDTLASGAYAVIADNPIKFLEDWPAFSGQLFDSAFSLKNDGEALIVRDAELTDIDSVTFSPDQGATGDGETLHRTDSNTNTFTASAPTPGKGNLSVLGGVYESGESESTDEVESGEQAKNTNTVQYVAPKPSLYAYAGENRDVIVGADTVFVGRAVNADGELIESNIRYIWNFGDGKTTEGEKVTHAWKHPGRYALVLDVVYNKSAVSDRITVTAREAGISISVDEEGNIALQNGSRRDLDISFWHLQSLGLHFTIPENTFLLGGETVVFYRDTTGLPLSGDIALLYPNGTVAYSAELKNEENNNVDSEDVITEIIVEQVESETVVSKDFISGSTMVKNPPVSEEEEMQESQIASAVAAPGIIEGGILPSSPWVVGLLLIIGIGAIGAAAAKSASRDEYTIIEEKD